jgi:hypothetical protein
MADIVQKAAGAVGRTIERGIADVGTGLHTAANAVGSVLETLGGGTRVYSRGSENHAGSAPNTANHQGVSHAPNAGPAMQGHVSARPASWAGLPNESNSHDSDARSHADVPGISKSKGK